MLRQYRYNQERESFVFDYTYLNRIVEMIVNSNQNYYKRCDAEFTDFDTFYVRKQDLEPNAER